ncbi:MAG: TatD family hydrolase [Planctomycetales bacterium]|nr:TatD family hydrolase [Planctomycetales bacterium]MCA9167878.1 TatD family hydrolase [Planctomycetales bacterium]
MELVDTHAHLDDERLIVKLDEVLADARAAGVVAMIAVGTTLSSSRAVQQLAMEHAPISAAVGIQPNYCAEAAETDWAQIVELAGQPKVVALGETGLDRYWNDCPFELQQDYFDRHLRLSQERDLPFIVHMRECQEDVLIMLREARERGPLRGVMHSYTGDLPGAIECIEIGLHISFAGMVTYPKSTELRAVAAGLPLDRILIETDSPYLSPHPHRGVRPNHPALVVNTAQCLADARGESLAELAAATRNNSRELFGI